MRKHNVMTKLTSIAGVLVLLLVAGCVGAGDTPSEEILEGKVVLVQNNIHAQNQPDRGGKRINRGSYANWTNPGAGHFFLPVNTQVTIGKWRRGCTMTEVKTGKIIYYEINRRNVGMSVAEYLDLITGTTAASLGGLSGIDKKGIKQGKVFKGMSKKGVRIALGYPSPHQTPSLEENKWTYWQNRYQRMQVEFGSNGKVMSIWK